MSLWNYMGEFFLFRWLFGKFKKSPTEHNAHIESLCTSIDRDTKSLNDNYNEDATPIDDAIVPILNITPPTHTFKQIKKILIIFSQSQHILRLKS